MKLRLAGIALFLVACGTSGKDGGPCGAAACTATACGTVTDACGATIECSLCRYDDDAVGGGSGTIRLFPGGARVAYKDAQAGISVATRGAPWTIDAVPDSVGDDVLGAANASDGTVWVLHGQQSALHLAREQGGVWSDEQVLPTYTAAALALDSDGAPWIAYSGENGMNGDGGVILAHRDAAGAWTYQTAAATTGLDAPYLDLTMTASGPVVAWTHDADASLGYAEPDGHGGYATAVVDAELPGYVEHELAVRIDGDGDPVIAYRRDSPFDRAIGFAVRSGGTWTTGLASTYDFGDGDVRMAVSASGLVAVVYQQDLGYQVAVQASGAWAVQTVAPESCEGGDLDVSFDGDTLVIARQCRGQVDLITRNGALYPSGYASTCAAVATALCTKGAACAGSSDGTGCIADGFCAGPQPYCTSLAGSDICGDPTLDPGVLAGCSAAVDPGALTCTTTGSGPAVAVPAACPYTF